MANGVIHLQSNVCERNINPITANDFDTFMKTVFTSSEVSSADIDKTIVINTKWAAHNTITFIIRKETSLYYSFILLTSTSLHFGNYNATTDTVIVRQVSYT